MSGCGGPRYVPVRLGARRAWRGKRCGREGCGQYVAASKRKDSDNQHRERERERAETQRNEKPRNQNESLFSFLSTTAEHPNICTTAPKKATPTQRTNSERGNTETEENPQEYRRMDRRMEKTVSINHDHDL